MELANNAGPGSDLAPIWRHQVGWSELFSPVSTRVVPEEVVQTRA